MKEIKAKSEKDTKVELVEEGKCRGFERGRGCSVGSQTSEVLRRCSPLRVGLFLSDQGVCTSACPLYFIDALISDSTFARHSFSIGVRKLSPWGSKPSSLVEGGDEGGCSSQQTSRKRDRSGVPELTVGRNQRGNQKIEESLCWKSGG